MITLRNIIKNDGHIVRKRQKRSAYPSPIGIFSSVVILEVIKDQFSESIA